MMKTTLDIPWKRYALITELAERLNSSSPRFGKTALQKLVFFLQEIYHIDCGYYFELYTYGPYDSQLLNDLDLVEHWGGVSVTRANDTFGGYQIRPAGKADSIRNKAKDFLDDKKTRQAIDDLVSVYGSMTAKDLELRATTVYVAKNLCAKESPAINDDVCRLVRQIKPKFEEEEINSAITELSERHHIQVSAIYNTDSLK